MERNNYELMISVNQNLSFDYAKKVFEKSGDNLNESDYQNLAILNSDGLYTNLGLLLSDQCPFSIQAATFSGFDKTKLQNRCEFNGSVFKQMEELYDYLDLRNQLGSTITGLYRKDYRDYPLLAIKEALINFIVHRDYSISASSLVSVFTDRMEFVNFGGLMKEVELDDIMLGVSICRNEKLTSIFYRLHLIEAYGTGIPNIFNCYKDDIKKPKIEVSNNAFKVTLYNCNAPLFSNFTLRDYDSYENQLINLASQKEQIVRSDVENLLKVSQATANRLLSKMVNDGYLYQLGRGKTIRYILKK